MRLMRDQSPSFRSLNLLLVMLNPIPSYRSPSRRRANHSHARATAATAKSQSQSRAAVRPIGRLSRATRVVSATLRGIELVGVLLDRHRSTATALEPVPVLAGLEPCLSASRAVEAERVRTRPLRTRPGERKRASRRPRHVHSKRMDGRSSTTGRTARAAPRAGIDPAEQPARCRGDPGAVACSLEPPRNAHRHSPSTATITSRTRPASRPNAAGRAAPRRPSCAVSATQSPASGVDWDEARSRGEESTGWPSRAPATGDASAAVRYQSPTRYPAPRHP